MNSTAICIGSIMEFMEAIEVCLNVFDDDVQIVDEFAIGCRFKRLKPFGVGRFNVKFCHKILVTRTHVQ